MIRKANVLAIECAHHSHFASVKFGNPTQTNLAMKPRAYPFLCAAILASAAFRFNSLAQPVLLPGLTISLEASAGVTADGSGNLGGWTDQAATGSSFGAGSEPFPPTLTAGGPGGAPYIHFGATSVGATPPNVNTGSLTDSSGRTSSTLFSSDQDTLFLVVRAEGQSSPLNWANGLGGGPLGLALQPNGGATLITFHDGDGPSAIRANAPSFAGSWHVLTLERNGDSGVIRVDGVSLSLQSGFDSFASTIGSSATGLYGLMGLGGPGGNPQLGDSLDLAALYNYKTALSGADVVATEEALGAEFGVTVVPEPSLWAWVTAVALGAFALVRRSSR